MQPSKEKLAAFVAFAPGSDEGAAFMYLEVSIAMPLIARVSYVTDCTLKSANTLSEAVDQYYENPAKFSHNLVKTPEKAKIRPGAPSPAVIMGAALRRPHTNAVIEAGSVRARDEQEMQNMLQSVQLAYRIYNPEIEPDHDADYYCGCAIHQYKRRQMNRLGVQHMWSKAVMYPGEKAYHGCYQMPVFTNNPYSYSVISPYGFGSSFIGIQIPDPHYHAKSVHQTIKLNAALNVKAQASINSKEPNFSIWEIDQLETSMSNMAVAGPSTYGDNKSARTSKISRLKNTLSIKSSEERAVSKLRKRLAYAVELQNAILEEENYRWPGQNERRIVVAYQENIGMVSRTAELRARQPIQYLHLLRAGYFEPIPVNWANLASNPLKFTIDVTAGWRGITPAWRGYEDTAEERLYWVLNHREGVGKVRLKPDMISALSMARARMASAVEPPPAYYSPDDTCYVQHTSKGYSRQVMPAPFRSCDAPEVPTDDTMILLDVSGSMEFDPIRPNYNQYLITEFSRSTQPKNKGVLARLMIDLCKLLTLCYRRSKGHHPSIRRCNGQS